MNSWKNYFNSHYQILNENDDNTSATVDFLVDELNIAQGDSVLDIGCGDGRHLIELAKRGYNCTGIDFSERMIKLARQNAESKNVEIKFIQACAQDYVSENKFDAIISLRQGAFCLLEQADNSWSRDMAILANMAQMMPVSKKYAVSFLNAYYLVNNTEQYKDLDLFLLTAKNKDNLIERFYTPSEVVRMVNRIGLKADNIYAVTDTLLRPKSLSFSSMEFIVIGHRKDHKGKKNPNK